ncbi:MAG: hypothetical protein GY759_03195 [Chloroflexi bacterium]|nr:hypothetical protein [Chloroflexota bacterium]
MNKQQVARRVAGLAALGFAGVSVAAAVVIGIAVASDAEVARMRQDRNYQ